MQAQEGKVVVDEQGVQPAEQAEQEQPTELGEDLLRLVGGGGAASGPNPSW